MTTVAMAITVHSDINCNRMLTVTTRVKDIGKENDNLTSNKN